MIQTRENETIIAQATPRGSGALAIIRLSGDNAIDIVTALSRLSQNKSLNDVPTHTIHYGHMIASDGTTIDQVMFSVMRNPRTFTGQDIIEITCHNNPFIIEAIIQACIARGARHARHGEFSMRAFLNGKIDLLQAEAINELINAQTQSTLKKSLAQLQGTLSQWLFSIESRLLRTLAWCEASFEFLDEETEFKTEIAAELDNIIKTISHAKNSYDVRKAIKEGIRIALIGSVNAGKSSLFNHLVGHERSIVTNQPGTTRDSIEAGVFHNSHFLTFIDTAGIRQTDDIVEKEGVRRSFEEAHKADIILLIYDQTRELTPEEKIIYDQIVDKFENKIIIVQNKYDLKAHASFANPKAIYVSGLSGLNCNALIEEIENKIQRIFKSLDTAFLLNTRQYSIIIGIENNLKHIAGMMGNVLIPYELISFHLRETLELMTELTGKSISEAAINQVFKEFCVGK